MSVRSLVVAALVAALIACQSEAPIVPSAAQHEHPVPAPAKGAPEAGPDLSALRQATVQFHDFDLAKAAGWDEKITDCLDDPAGGMGYHYANLSLLLDAELDPARPEALLYEPGPNGKLRLVGVEYIIPRPLWTHPEPPVLYGQEFPYVPEFDVYGLHAWVWRGNPQGVFMPWNPTVSCKNAPIH